MMQSIPEKTRRSQRYSLAHDMKLAALKGGGCGGHADQQSVGDQAPIRILNLRGGGKWQ
jgi:hypothetical protein